ncbi:MAG: polysaccharide deacetylase family protein [Pyrinomonadaceae bacterium]
MLPPLLLYHKISKPRRDSKVRGAFTPPQRFRRQLTYLKQHGFKFYTASELIKHFQSHGNFPERALALTFDDGWQDNFTNAFPVLKELEIKATIFIIPSSIGQMSTDATTPAGDRGYPHLSREEILEMAKAGIEFGSHTMSHAWLNQLPESEVKSEIETAKREIENLVQQPCWTIAYPAGYFSDAARRSAQEAGHIAGFSTIYGPTDPLDLFALNRLEVLRRDRFNFQFARKLAPLLCF